jgi:unsaturated rhamnogalacturonyl hydrolase
MTRFICALALAAMLGPSSSWGPPSGGPPELKAQLEAVAKLRGEPSIVSAAGITRNEDPILTIENGSAFELLEKRKRRLVIVGSGNDDHVIDAVIAAVKWMKTNAPADLRQEWVVSAMPAAGLDRTDPQSLTRWVVFQAPDLVIGVGDAAAGPPEPVGIPGRHAGIPAERFAAELPGMLRVARDRWSPMQEVMAARLRRSPLDIAALLAKRYPGTPSISYIPSVSWVNTLRLSTISGDTSLRQKVLDQIAPWLSGEPKMFGDRIQLTAVAGAMVFADLSKADGGETAARLANEAAALAAAVKPDGIAQYGGGWTDDMFMASSILSRTGKIDDAARLLSSYAARLQRPDGLFNHAIDGPAAWGRGNGFAALGLTEALTAMPDQHPSRPALLEIYRRHMAAVKDQQAPDGMWREVIDNPAAYREETATAMLLTAMARGIRLGWIDRSYRPLVERAWRALTAHVADDGTVIDVCTGTGAGPTPRYYFDRAAITGADDRGGAMALLASMEMYEFERK